MANNVKAPQRGEGPLTHTPYSFRGWEVFLGRLAPLKFGISKRYVKSKYNPQSHTTHTHLTEDRPIVRKNIA